jgi:hypothetical protein
VRKLLTPETLLKNGPSLTGGLLGNAARDRNHGGGAGRLSGTGHQLSKSAEVMVAACRSQP